ncbi:MAG: hypothetical protein MZU84_08125 [Sphingobacterium sp.]|nr:hypothetical protein [Sphingobacterium sp.]
MLGGWFRNYDFEGNKIWDGGLVEFQGQLRNFWHVQRDVRLQPGDDQQEPDPGRAAGAHAVGLPVEPGRHDGQPQAGRVRVPRDDVPAAGSHGGVGRQPVGALEAGLELQPVGGTDALVHDARDPVGDAGGRPVDDVDLWPEVRGRGDRPEGHRERRAARLDVHAAADAPGLPAAVSGGGEVLAVQGAGRAEDLRLQHVRGGGGARRRSATTAGAASTRSIRTGRRARPRRSRSGIQTSTSSRCGGPWC